MDLHRQLRELTTEAGFKIGPRRLESPVDDPTPDAHFLAVTTKSINAYWLVCSPESPISMMQEVKGAGNMELQIMARFGAQGTKAEMDRSLRGR